ncbi:hypothetical protein ILYODFUR_025352 [Ilyodon furcidens]|uniref:Secreted protein n=1 Tax=Ilyodon furcidens TaxID=33524 RepID=A0ABV0UW44_9TELE
MCVLLFGCMCGWSLKAACQSETGHSAMGKLNCGSCCSLQQLFPDSRGNFWEIGNQGLAIVIFPLLRCYPSVTAAMSHYTKIYSSSPWMEDQLCYSAVVPPCGYKRKHMCA